MSERPTEDIEWAEGEGAEVAEPENLRGQGWPVGFVPPAEHANWLQRAAGRWIQWLADKLDNHVHDGGEEPESVAKIDLEEHIGYGENGRVSITKDTELEYEIQLINMGGGVARLVADGAFFGNLGASGLEVDTLLTDGLTSTGDIDAENHTVTAGTFDGSSANISGNTTLNSLTLGGIFTATDRATFTDELNHPAVPKSVIRVLSNGTLERSAGWPEAGISVSGSSGDYSVTFLGGIENEHVRSFMVCAEPLAGTTPEFRSATAYVASSPANDLEIRVNTFDSDGVLTAANFHLHTYWEE